MTTRIAASFLVLLAGCSATPEDGAGEPEITPYRAGNGEPRRTPIVVGEHVRVQRITIDVDGVELADVMREISEQVGEKIVVGKDIEEVVRISLKDVPWREAVDVIARMTRVDIEERDGALILYRHFDIWMGFHEADVRPVLKMFAAFQGLDVTLADDVRGTLTGYLGGYLDTRSALILSYLEAIVRTAGLHAELKDGLLTVTARAGGDFDLDGLMLPPAPLPEGTPPRNVLRARGASLGAWIQLLGSYAKRDVIVSGGVGTRIDADLENEHWLQAILQATSKAGATVRQEGLLVSVTRPAKPADESSKPVALTLQLPRGREVEVTVEATVTLPREAKAMRKVVISGRVYREGDFLEEEAADERAVLPVVVERITTKGIRLRVEGQEQPVVVRFPPER